ncbi:cysteine desulfurase [Salipaludibacillus keqinensis]|uniref:Cysteine desulfurase n=1 Tax=Salipaludibacillus keqinensis TaxID=2045207 RepID=A0A323TH31_9BACI|nr:IscS subfamily cysteine desulfurase [Salipaludibacillus keqinensis]PYZ94079.1 cysteine desulfurase [Salipaludibacillus keqinensis]
MIYLDHAATTPISSSAMKTWIKANEDYFANASSLHEAGEQASQLFITCKKQLAKFVGMDYGDVFFTSGGSESNDLALQSLYLSHKHRGNHVITSSIEHPTVHSFFRTLEENGVEVTYLPVNTNGLVSLEDIKSATRPDTFLASIQHVNSEIGVIQPLASFGEWFIENGIVFHSDCVQSFGKIPIHMGNSYLDALSISSHKIRGPKGVGAVVMSKNVDWSPVHPLTSHQEGFRPGTLNVPGIAAFTQAAIDMYEHLEEKRANAWQLRKNFIDSLTPIRDRLHIEGLSDDSMQLPNILGLSIKGVQGQYMLLSLDRFQICISTGSACQSNKLDSSSAMNAIYSTEQERLRFFRISFGYDTTSEELAYVAEKIIDIAKE